MDLEPQVELEFAVLADRAEVVGGKLYLMGGGWERIQLMNPQEPVFIAVALGIQVPWSATNIQHSAEVVFLNEDGQRLEPVTTFTFTAGRPPQLRPGEGQRVMVAINLALRLPAPGSYAAAVYLNGELVRQLSFSAVTPS